MTASHGTEDAGNGSMSLEELMDLQNRIEKSSGASILNVRTGEVTHLPGKWSDNEFDSGCGCHCADCRHAICCLGIYCNTRKEQLDATQQE